MTIDPATAKDFDDAISLERLEPNAAGEHSGAHGAGAHGVVARGAGAQGDAQWRLWVHIADVANFVAPGGEIDREALQRGTSIYPVDRVVPMLPERLSNDLCSLRPGVDRLCMTVEMDLDSEGAVLESRFYRSIIHSRHRLTYEEVQAVYDDSPEAPVERLGEARETLLQLRDLTRVLRKRRIARGALDLDIPEVEIVFDERGKPSDIRHRPRLESHSTVEECMLLANEVVASRLAERGDPVIFRVHEAAQPDALERLDPQLRCFGIRIASGRGKLTPKAIQSALEQAERQPAGHILRRLILRAMARARYSVENLGHFGLASPCYCHFTSPIRRYPDLTVHRLIAAMLDDKPAENPANESESSGRKTPRAAGKRKRAHEILENEEGHLSAARSHDSIEDNYTPDDSARREWSNDAEEVAALCSETEREAQQIEWDSTALKALEFMKVHVGEDFDGFICGVQPYGLYMELRPYPVEGLIPIRALPYDRYDLDDPGVALIGRRRGRKYRLGDQLRVRIERVDIVNLQMDLALSSR